MSENTYNLFRYHLKSKRKKLGLSLQVLSERSGVSKSLISKIERNEIQPSIKTASNIAQGLGFAISDMFRDEDKPKVIYHPTHKQFVLTNGEHHTKIKVSPVTSDICIEIYHEHLNADSVTDSLSDGDENQFVLAMTDGLSITINETKYTLNQGDCIYIAENISYSIHNEGSSQANFITIMHHP